MRMVMCLDCGEFISAFPGEETVQPSKEACPACGGTLFKDPDAGETIDTTET